MRPSVSGDTARSKLQDIRVGAERLMFVEKILDLPFVEEKMVVPPVHDELVSQGRLEIALRK